VEARSPVGVPEITQLVLLMDAHAGSTGEIVQLVISAPLLLRVDGIMFMGRPAGKLVVVTPE
jgi:hypothetical protein